MSENKNSVKEAEFTVSHAALARAIKSAEFGVTGRISGPITGVLFDTEDGKLTLRTHDFELSVAVEVPEATVTACGRTVLSHAEFKACLAASVAGETAAEAARTLVTVSGDSLSTAGMTVPVTGYDVREYPEPRPAAATLLTVDAADLVRQLGRVLPVVGTDDTMPALTLVQMDAVGTTLKVRGTDRYRMAIAELPATCQEEDLPEKCQAHFPGRILKKLTSQFKSIGGRAGIGVTPDAVTLRLGDIEITTTPYEGHLPRYDTLMATTFATEVPLDRQALVKAVKKCQAVLRAKKSGLSACALSFDTDGGVTALPCLDEPEQRSKVKGIKIRGEASPETVKILDGAHLALNPAYLLDALAAFDGETVTIRTHEPDDLNRISRMITIIDGPTGYTHILQPIRLND